MYAHSISKRLRPLALCLMAVAACACSLWAQDPADVPDAPAAPSMSERADKAKEDARKAADAAKEKAEQAADAARAASAEAAKRAREAAKEAEIAAEEARKLADEAAELTRTYTDSAVTSAGELTDSGVVAVKQAYEKFRTGGTTVGGVTVYEPSDRNFREVDGPGKVLVLRLEGEVGPSMVNLTRLAYMEVEDDEQIRAVVLDMNTPGGRLDSTSEILGIIAAANVPTYTYVNRDAGSAGAIIAFGTRGIYMHPSGKIGSATTIMMSPTGVEAPDGDVKAKFSSWSEVQLRSLSKENGHIPEVGYAMKDPDFELIIGETMVCPAGEVLALTADEAVAIIPPLQRPLLARAIVPGLEDMPAAIGMGDAELQVFQVSSAQAFANIILFLSPFLIMGFMIGLYIEVNTPGVGLPAGVALFCLALFGLGQYMTGYSTAWEPVIVFIGLILLAIEIFWVPGFGAIGLLGILTIIAGVVMMMVPEIHVVDIGELDSPFSGVRWGYLESALIRLGLGVGFGGLGVIAAARFLPHSALFKRLALSKTSSREDGYVSFDVKTRATYLGQEGVAVTDLRPAGTVKLAKERIDVVSDGDFIQKGDRVRVTEVNGPRIAVVRLSDASEPAAEAQHGG